MRESGANTAVFIAATSGGSASRIPFVASWNFDSSTDTYEVTSPEDGNKTFVAGKANASVALTGFYDSDANDATLFTLSRDGLPRASYLYHDFVNDPTHYMYGLFIWDYSQEHPVAGAATISANGSAAGTVGIHVGT